ncbi:ABC transporter substrate-binding protein [Alkaliphilus sp. B6464]|uniref:ABC transporter substrate-binding protein n=1 Tax=Alkaliphilus sp. B6464 TaxID=2731219 RepID=UPI001BA836C3|nr:ABC transporter substrate-binding protein [Alkaliphilus sp. B6464]QUH21392.1 ABC transporter substrate-binding protein [Alkaliphilus sp. B6464]
MRKSKATIFLVVLMLLTTLLFGCVKEQKENLQGDVGNNIGNTAYPMDIVDGFGNSVTIEKQPERVVSIAPSQTEILFALGLEDKIVGVSDFCDYPIEALEKEKVGNAFAINVEKILELNPDVVFLYNEALPESIEQIKASGIAVMLYSPETIDEIFNTILQLGEVMGVEEESEQIVNEMQEKRDNIVDKAKNEKKARVFYQVWDEPLMTAGEGSFINELITLAGGENIAADGDGAYPQYSVEAMVEKDPEIYIAPAHTAENFTLNPEQMKELKNIIKSRPGYDVITAVKNDKIELLDPNIVSRPGVRTIEALELFAKAIHPEVF